MKGIIDGLRYDTQKATRVAKIKSHLPCNDFSWYWEGLYKTANGRWFLAGEGNFSSKWNWQDVEPLDAVDAMLWLEHHGKTDELEEYFGDRITDA